MADVIEFHALHFMNCIEQLYISATTEKQMEKPSVGSSERRCKGAKLCRRFSRKVWFGEEINKVVVWDLCVHNKGIHFCVRSQLKEECIISFVLLKRRLKGL